MSNCSQWVQQKMQPFPQGVSGHPPTQPNTHMTDGASSMQYGAPGSLQSPLTPGVHIYGQTPGANSMSPGQTASITTAAYGTTTNTIYPNQVNWNNDQMYYQNRYCSRYRWQLFFNQSRHKATVWHRVRFVKPKIFCPECFVPRVLDSDDEELGSDGSTNQDQGSLVPRQCVSSIQTHWWGFRECWRVDLIVSLEIMAL